MAESMKISGIEFSVNSPYAAGHVLTEVEAAALNQQLHDNIRNNFAPRVRKAQEDATANGSVVDVEALKASFAEYAANYQFGTKRERGENANDPVAKEALRLAKEAVKAKLKDQGHNLKKVGSEKINELAAGLVVKNPSFTERAKANIEANGGIDLDDVAVEAEPVAEAA